MEITVDESKMNFEAELIELSKLAFYKTNISKIDKKDSKPETTSISTQHLNTWTRPDFVIKLSNDGDDDVSYHVHKLILCGRWKYFCLMIESGMKEANNNEMTLSDDWNKSRFEKMMKYIYLNEIDFEELEDVAWLMENRKLYGIAIDNSQQNNHNTETNQAEQNQTQEIPAYGFEDLYEHCIKFLHQP